MAGYIIYNGFWNPHTPPEPVRQLATAAPKYGVVLTPLSNTRLIARFDGDISVSGIGRGDFALFWDKDIRLARTLEAMGVRLYNSAQAVALCDDKSATHLALAQADIPMPTTLVAPMTYVSIDVSIEPFLWQSEQALGFPMVVKECFGSLGGQVYLARDREELRRLAYAMGPRPFLTQKFLSAHSGTDWRLYVVGGEVVAAIRRHHPHDFRANIAGGGVGEAYTPTKQETALAVRCCEILGADFAGVDILHDGDQPVVCEVNSNAFMTAICSATGVDVPDAIIRHVLQKEGISL